MVLPGFGGFILKPQKAVITAYHIVPPSKTIAFNTGIQLDDGLLTGALMASDNLTYLEAQNAVRRFSNQASYLLKKNKQYLIANVGQFILTESGSIQFNPSSNEGLDRTNFGFETLHIAPLAKEVIKDKLPSKSIADESITSRKKANRRYTEVLLALTLLLMIGCFSMMTSSKWEVQESNLIENFFPVIEDDVYPSSEIRNIGNDVLVAVVEKQKEEISSVLSDILEVNQSLAPTGYYMIVGSYSTSKNAAKMQQELAKKNQLSYLIKGNNGFSRVGIFLSGNPALSQDKFNDMRSSYKDSWLLVNK